MDKNVLIPRLVMGAIFTALIAAPYLQADEYTDMSDPITVCSQGGLGYTENGLEIAETRCLDGESSSSSSSSLT